MWGGDGECLIKILQVHLWIILEITSISAQVVINVCEIYHEPVWVLWIYLAKMLGMWVFCGIKSEIPVIFMTQLWEMCA